jgi:hypothetical protein
MMNIKVEEKVKEKEKDIDIIKNNKLIFFIYNCNNNKNKKYY